MKLTAKSTTKIVILNGVPARIWEAETESGIKCHLYVTRVGAADDQDLSQFERELAECAAPTPEVEAIPARLIL